MNPPTTTQAPLEKGPWYKLAFLVLKNDRFYNSFSLTVNKTKNGAVNIHISLTMRNKISNLHVRHRKI